MRTSSGIASIKFFSFLVVSLEISIFPSPFFPVDDSVRSVSGV